MYFLTFNIPLIEPTLIRLITIMGCLLDKIVAGQFNLQTINLTKKNKNMLQMNFLHDYDSLVKDHFVKLKAKKMKSITSKNSPSHADNNPNSQYFSPFQHASGRLKVNLQQKQQPSHDKRLSIYQISPVGFPCGDSTFFNTQKQTEQTFTREILRKKTLSGKIITDLSRDSEVIDHKRKSSSSALKVSNQLKHLERTPTYEQEETNRLKPNHYEASSASKSQYTAGFFRQSVTERLLQKQLTSNSSRDPNEKSQKTINKNQNGSSYGMAQDNSSIDGNEQSFKELADLPNKQNTNVSANPTVIPGNMDTFKKVDEPYNDKVNDFSERTDQLNNIFRKRSSNNIQKIQLFPNSQKNLYNQDQSPLYKVENPIIENLNTENNSICNSQVNKSYFVSDDSQIKDDDIFSQEYTQHHPFRFQAINQLSQGNKFDHLRYIQKDTFSSNGSPDIIIRAPEDENSSEAGTAQNMQSGFNLMKVTNNQQQSYQQSTFKQKNEEQKMMQDYVIQVMDDKYNSRIIVGNNALQIKKKETNITHDRRKRKLRRQVGSSDANGNTNSGDLIQHIKIKNPSQWKQKQLFQLVNNVLVPIITQINPEPSQSTRQPKKEDSSTSFSQNNIQRIKTIKEVNEDTLDNYLLTNNTNTDSHQDERQSSSNNTGTSQQLQNSPLTTINQESTQNSNVKSNDTTPQSQFNFLQPNYIIQTVTPYQKIKNMELELKNISRTKNMIALIRKKNQDMITTQDKNQRKLSDQVLYKDDSQKLFRKQNTKKVVLQKQDSIGFDKQITPAFGSIQIPILNNNMNSVEKQDIPNSSVLGFGLISKPETPFGHSQMAQQHSFKSSFRSELESSISRGNDESFEGASYYIEDEDGEYDDEEDQMNQSLGSLESYEIQQTETNTILNKLQRVGTENKRISHIKKMVNQSKNSVESQIQLPTAVNIINSVKDSQNSHGTQPRHFRLRGIVSNQSSLKSTERYISKVDQSQNLSQGLTNNQQSTPLAEQTQVDDTKRYSGMSLDQSITYNDKSPTINFINAAAEDEDRTKIPRMNFADPRTITNRHTSSNAIGDNQQSFLQSPFDQLSQQHSLTPTAQVHQSSYNSFTENSPKNSDYSKSPFQSLSQMNIPSFQSKQTEKPSLLTTDNLKLLEDPYGNRKIGPRSITTNSVISTRKNGKKKINQYVLQKELGSGNFAKVYECINEDDQKSYAMKIIKKNKLKRQFQFSKKKAETFLETEMAILKKLDHPNVLALYEIINDQTTDKLYFVTEIVLGGSLGHKINGKKPIPEEDIWSYFRDLISALEYCHECAQIIHRDIKPENILVDENNKVRLADFGVSHIMIDGKDEIQNRAGSQFYFAPEIIKQNVYNGRPIDIWACGVTLYQMFTKKMPFLSQNVQELQTKILNDEPDYTVIEDELVRDLLQKIFQKDHTKRLTLQQVKDHPYLTKNGTQPMPKIAGKKIEITEKDLRQVFTRVVKMARVINKFRNSSHSPFRQN
eukprot:403336004